MFSLDVGTLGLMLVLTYLSANALAALWEAYAPARVAPSSRTVARPRSSGGGRARNPHRSSDAPAR